MFNSADIDLIPDYDKYCARSAFLSTNGLAKGTIPSGWPRELYGPLVWEGRGMMDEKQYVFELEEGQKAEISRALDYCKALHLEYSKITKECFPLPQLGPVLENYKSSIDEGVGFFILRGLDPSNYPMEDNVIIFLGISSYISERRGRQDVKGGMINHIFDATNSSIPRDKRSTIFGNDAQPFHADVLCGVLAFYCLNAAAEGGRSILASSWRIYNELARTRPDIIQTLAQDDWVHQELARNPPYRQRPLLFCHEGSPILNFSRRSITGSTAAPRLSNIPPITEAQAEALDAVHFLAQKYSLSTSLHSGDMRFVNNLALLHCRDDFKDSPTMKRHMLRLWLWDDQKTCPPGLQYKWDDIFAEDTDTIERWELDADASVEQHGIGGTSRCG